MKVQLLLGSRQDGLVNALLEITAEPSPGREKPSLNIALALDTSGSMGREKLGFAKMAAENFIRWMNRRDRFALVTYNSDVKTQVALQNLTDKDTVIQNLYAIGAGGNTNLSGGYLEAVKELLPAKGSGVISRVILLTDGQANEGITDLKQLEKLATRYHAEGISLSCVGCGVDFDGPLLKKLADAGMGNFHFVEKAEEAPNIFFQEFGEIAGLAAQNARAQITLSSDVTIEEAFADLTPVGNHEYHYSIGDMIVDRPVRIPVMLRLGERPQPMRVALEYFDLETTDFVKVEKTLEIPASVVPADAAAVDGEICIGRARRIIAAGRLAAEADELERAAELTTSAIALLEANRSLSPARIDAELAAHRRYLERLMQNETRSAELIATARSSAPASFKPEGPVVVKAFEPNTVFEMMVVPDIRDELEAILDKTGRHSLILDLTNVNYVDSSGLGMLVGLLRRWNERRCTFVMAAPGGTLRSLFQISRLDTFFRIFDSVQSAREFIEGAAHS